jgi:voltage-gated potassium channel
LTRRRCWRRPIATWSTPTWPSPPGRSPRKRPSWRLPRRRRRSTFWNWPAAIACCNWPRSWGTAWLDASRGRDAKSHVIGRFGKLQIAEASAAGTPLENRTLREIRLPEFAPVNVVGVWERGKFSNAGPETRITRHTVLLLAGTQAQLDEYDGLFCIYSSNANPVVIIGGGKVGQACARGLAKQKIAYSIVEKLPDVVTFEPERLVQGDAADVEVLRRAGLFEAPAVVITSHDDDVNVYLTLYCRKLRPDIQIISRSTLDRNVETLHRAGADFVMSYASMGANAIFNLLRRNDVLLVAEGLSAFEVEVPPKLVNRTLAQSAIREQTGCNVIALQTGEQTLANPGPETLLPAQGVLILLGTADAEEEFMRRYLSP